MQQTHWFCRRNIFKNKPKNYLKLASDLSGFLTTVPPLAIVEMDKETKEQSDN